MSNTGKDVVYIDVDDEITAVIDKVRSSQEKIVALVLPKRAAVFQSIVNMKLLKRTADEAKKHLVLITSEAGLLPLAGNVGLYVAKSLQSKPEIPNGPGAMQQDDDEIEENFAVPVAAGTAGAASGAAAGESIDKSRSVGDYLRNGGTGPLSGMPNDEDVIELDNDSANEMVTPSEAKADAKKSRKDKKLLIPDFTKFRLWLIIGGAALVVLIIGWYMAAVTMPKAALTIKTDGIAVNSNINMTLKTDATKLVVDDGIVPAQTQQTLKTQTQQVDATGQKDKGTKASGSISLKNCTDNAVSVPGGTGISAGGLTFITQSNVTMDAGNFSSGGVCRSNGGHIRSVNVVAQQAGEQYNLASRTDYKVAGISGNVSGEGSAMSGGTSQVVKVVTQSDIDSAKQKLSEQDTSAVKQELQKGLIDKDLYAIVDTFASTDPAVSNSANVGDEATNITVTQKVTYTMIGVKQDDLKSLISNAVTDKIDSNKRSILDYGLDQAVFNIESQAGTRTTVSMQATAVAGSQLDLNAIKKQVAGKKASEAESVIKKNPGVSKVTVEYSPFWVSSIPKNTDKITLVVEKPQTKNATDE